MKKIGILFHPRKAASRPLADEIAAWLAERGIDTWIGSTWDEADGGRHLRQMSLLVVLGGDGSILRAGRLAAPYGIPLFSINMGRVGFLSEASPDAWQGKLALVLADQYWIERRLMLQADWQRDGEVLETFTALNDVVVSRGTQARVVHLNLYVDDDYVTTYTADGLIVATPTGSTAYAMAAGGPILPPELKNFLIMPVAAHLSLDRPLVLHQEAAVAIQVHMDHEATMTTDGQSGLMLRDGDRVVVRKYGYDSCFVRVGRRSYFYHSLLERLGVNGRFKTVEH